MTTKKHNKLVAQPSLLASSNPLNKKGQGLSLNIIIIGVIALVILMVIIAIVTGHLGKFVGEAGGGHLECDTGTDKGPDRVTSLKCDGAPSVHVKKCKDYREADNDPSIPIEEQFRCLKKPS